MLAPRGGNPKPETRSPKQIQKVRNSQMKLWTLDFGRWTLDFQLLDWDGIFAAASPRMAPADPLKRQPASAQGASAAYGFQCVFGATWFEATPAAWSKHEPLGR